ncbi:FAD:protein FMN transferase [Myxococcota bacterium]|nr:FAD:protein FMN transferase [Myxococcota bacterium]
MGSPCEIRFERSASMGEPEAGSVLAEAVAEIERLEARYSRYRETSLLSQINRVAATGGSLEVDPETASLLDYAATCHAQSGGLFDITSGILRRAWRFAEGRLPESGAIEALLPHVGFEKLLWRSPRLAFSVPGLELDFGGIVKEYAADRVAGLLQAKGLPHALVNLGGDVRVAGPRIDGGPWRIGIRHPRRAGELLGSVALREGALSTSGDYERCIEIDGVRYGHILDPRTGWPVRAMAAASVVAPLCVLAGSASTIAMLRGEAGTAWLEGLGLPCLWVDVEGRMGGSLARALAGTEAISD